MATVEQPVRSRASASGGARGAVVDLAAGSLLALGALAGSWRLLGLPASYLAIGAAIQAALVGLVLFRRPADLPGPGLGPANRVTLGRAALALPVLTLSVVPGALDAGTRWSVIALSTAVLLLDGVDGRVARRTRSQTAFGARFDMELDAALLMALSLLVWHADRAGAWVLLIGLMRYLFVVASWTWPALRAELPPSLRRKVVCVVQGVVLLVALGPIVPAAMAVAVCAAGLASLTWSFAVDVRWALVHAERSRRR